VVDDYEPFRQFVCSTLERSLDLQIVGEAADGLEAVRVAEELQPDLIVLDIGLPTLNGIEAARRMRKLCPASKILFVSQESTADIVQEALSVGALGYVLKANAGSELVTAVQTVCQGRRFISSRLAGHDFTGPSDTSARPFDQSTECARRHEVSFYSDDQCFLDGVTQFIGTALERGGAAILVATESHRKALLPRLQALGLDMSAAIEQGRYIPLDAAGLLSTFMVNALPDRAQFIRVAGDLILKAASAASGECPRVALCGEGTHLLWAEGNAEAALQLESLWDEIRESYDLDILCGYPLASFQGGIGSHIFEKLSAAHTAVHSR